MTDQPDRTPEFDASELEYISSAGLRMLLSVRKKAGVSLTVKNVTPEVYEIFEMTGFNSILNVKRKMRELSVEGCEKIGEGASGTVYRLDEDTVVKVFKENISLAEIENEREMARQAFMKGIPTAIPFDIVKVGPLYGSVFEMLKAVNCSELLASDPGRLDEITEIYAECLKTLHGIRMEEGRLPVIKKTYLAYLDDNENLFSSETFARTKALIEKIPDDLNVVHGDIQLKNFMYSDGELILIDMDTLSTGNPVFDFAGLFMTYLAFNEDEPDNTLKFTGLGKETCDEIFHKTLRQYFDTDDTELLGIIEEKISLLGYLRFLHVLTARKVGRPELLELRIRHALEHIEELAPKITDLNLKADSFELLG
jgi:uncharacterized protein (TIGR02172 family)